MCDEVDTHAEYSHQSGLVEVMSVTPRNLSND